MKRALLDINVLLALFDSDHVDLDRTRLHGPRQVTDAYLLALAMAHDGRFLTFDRSDEHLTVL